MAPFPKGTMAEETAGIQRFGPMFALRNCATGLSVTVFLFQALYLIGVEPLVSKSILVIDQDPDILGFLTLLFEARDIRVLRARTRAEALELLGREYVPVDLVLANLMTAQMENSDLCADVASLRRGVPVIYMSAFVDSGAIRIEALKSLSGSGLAAADGRGVLEAVLAALTRSRAAASGR
jgi:DNA-binding response OmpR family regulator